MENSAKQILSKYLSGQATADEQLALYKMIESADGRRQLYEQMDCDLQLLEQTDLRIDPALINRIYAEIRQRIRRQRQRRRLLQSAAVLLPFVLLGWFAWAVNARFGLLSPVNYTEISVEKGSCLQVVLHDGSQVMLSSGTRLRYPDRFAWGERRVEIDGQGFFQIKKYPNRPFIASSPHGDVRVTGTEFDFDSYSNSPVVKLSLFNGSVEFQSPSAPPSSPRDGRVQSAQGESNWKLIPGQQLAYDVENQRITVSAPADMSRVSEWKNHCLVFNRASLRELVAKLSQWYDAEFEITDPSLSAHTFTYSTEQKPLPEILADLQLISPLVFHQDGTRVRISRR